DNLSRHFYQVNIWIPTYCSILLSGKIHLHCADPSNDNLITNSGLGLLVETRTGSIVESQSSLPVPNHAYPHAIDIVRVILWPTERIVASSVDTIGPNKCI